MSDILLLTRLKLLQTMRFVRLLCFKFVAAVISVVYFFVVCLNKANTQMTFLGLSTKLIISLELLDIIRKHCIAYVVVRVIQLRPKFSLLYYSVFCEFLYIYRLVPFTRFTSLCGKYLSGRVVTRLIDNNDSRLSHSCS